MTSTHQGKRVWICTDLVERFFCSVAVFISSVELVKRSFPVFRPEHPAEQSSAMPQIWRRLTARRARPVDDAVQWGR